MKNITKKTGKVKNVGISFDGKTCWVGVDVHKASYTVAILDEDGERLEFSTVVEAKKVLQFLQMGMLIKALTYESGPTGYGLARACQEAGIPVVPLVPWSILHTLPADLPPYFSSRDLETYKYALPF